MKKLLFTLIIALTAVTQAAAYSFEVDGIYYNKNGTNATVTFRDNTYNSYSGEVIIPDTVTYDGVAYPVTAIGDYAFQNCDSLTAVTIPAAVTSIGSRAFYKCTLLDGVEIPETVTSIGSYAFQYCESMSKVTIPYGITSIGSYAFQYCPGIKWLVWNAKNYGSKG